MHMPESPKSPKSPAQALLDRYEKRDSDVVEVLAVAIVAAFLGIYSFLKRRLCQRAKVCKKGSKET